MADLTDDERLHVVLTRLRWHARPERLAVVGLAPRERLLALRLLPGLAGSFWQLVVEPDMLTLVLADRDWRAISQAFPRARVERPYRAISFDLDLPEGLVGFMALFSGVLAAAGVPLLAVCGYAKDHLLVREQYLDTALSAIEQAVMSRRP